MLENGVGTLQMTLGNFGTSDFPTPLPLFAFGFHQTVAEGNNSQQCPTFMHDILHVDAVHWPSM